MAATTIGEIQVIAKIDTSQYKKGAGEIDQTNKKMEQSGSKTTTRLNSGFNKAAKVGIAAIGVATAAAGALIFKNIGGAVERVDKLVAFPKVLKSLGASSEEAAAATDKLSKKLIGLPTSLSDGTAGVQRLVTAGLTVPKATDAFLGLNNALLASGAQAPQVESTMLQLTQALSRGKFEAQEWNSITANMPVLLGALQKSTGKSTEELKEMFKQDPQALMDKIIELNKKGGEGFESLEETARNATGGIGTAFRNLDNGIQRAMENVVRKLGDGNLEKGQKKISGAIDKISKAASDGIAKVGDFIGAIAADPDKLKATGIALSGFLALGIIELSKSLLGFVANPVVLGILALAGAFYLVATNWDKIKETLQPLIDLFKKFWEFIKPFRELIADQFAQAWEDLTKAFDDVKKSIAPMMPTLKLIGQIIGGVVLVVIGLFIAGLVITAAWIARLIGWIARFIGWFVKAGVETGRFIGNFVNTVRLGFQTAWNWITRTFGNIGKWFSDKFNGVKNTVINIFNNIVNFVKGIPGKIVNMFKNVGTSIGNAIKSALNSLLNLPLKVPSINIGGKKFGGQTIIPKLAEGGIISSATLAVVGEGREPEAVIPLSKLDKMLRNAGDTSGGKSATINQYNTVNTEVDMNVVNRQLTWEMNRA